MCRGANYPRSGGARRTRDRSEAAKLMLDLALLDVEAFGVAVIWAEAAHPVGQITNPLPCVVSCDRVHISLSCSVLLNGEVRSEGHRETSPGISARVGP